MYFEENDLTRNPVKFMIITGVRSGGTLLAHSLPYSETILNWEELKEEISNSEYGKYL